MLNLQVLDNAGTKTLLSVLRHSVPVASDVRIASAFVSATGLSAIRDALDRCVADGGQLEFLVGLDAGGTDPRAVWELYELAGKTHCCNMYCYVSRSAGTIYHPKLYLVADKEMVTAAVGSSNLTAAGLSRNAEVNVVLRGDIREEVMSDLYSAYNRLKFHQDRVIPDEELLRMYESLVSLGKAERNVTTPLRRDFVAKAATLKRPQAGPNDLVGWLKLVYAELPDGEFKNSDIYAKADVFRRFYPENQNVNAKIRQQLQELRAIDLVEHVSTGRWRRR
jgi:HKD family nuclease